MKQSVLILALAVFATACNSYERKKAKFINENIEFAVAQTQLMLDFLGEPTGKNLPRSMQKNGETGTTNLFDWTSGFFPGYLWYLYELTGDCAWRDVAEKWTAPLEPVKTYTKIHDVGFMMYCSFGNAERLASKPEYKDILVESANSLATRFSDRVNSIKSWDFRRGWRDDFIWQFPVIIDNMMNLDLMFYASRVTGDPRFYDMSVAHAYTSMHNHFRDDFSTYHVVDFDTITGEARSKETVQGLSDNSTWARGQAWAIYGFTLTYRETGNKDFLNAAIRATEMYLNDLPDDLIPYWDFNLGQEGFIPRPRSGATEFMVGAPREKPFLRDVSAATIVTSALFELSELTNDRRYYDYAVRMLRTLASPTYRAELGKNANFILKHSVGNIPHRSEIDVPIIYADYYFVEALVRYRNSNRR